MVLRSTSDKICRGLIRGKSKLFFADYYFYLRLIPSSTIRDINITRIERLLHSLLSGKPLRSVCSTLF